MDWLKAKVYNWFAPLFGVVIQDQVRHQLKQYYINQDEFMKKQEAYMISVKNFIDAGSKAASDEGATKALERIALAIETVKA